MTPKEMKAAREVRRKKYQVMLQQMLAVAVVEDDDFGVEAIDEQIENMQITDDPELAEFQRAYILGCSAMLLFLVHPRYKGVRNVNELL